MPLYLDNHTATKFLIFLNKLLSLNCQKNARKLQITYLRKRLLQSSPTRDFAQNVDDFSDKNEMKIVVKKYFVVLVT